MNLRRLAALIFCCVLLTGCQVQAAPALPSETSLPLETVTPTTEPEPVTEPGMNIVVDGDTLPSGSLLADGVTYVKAEEFLPALDDGTVSGNNAEGFILTLEGRTIQYGPQRPARTIQGALWIPLWLTCRELDISILNDYEQGILYCTSGISEWDLPEGIRVPVLMYHAVDSNVWGYRDLFVNPEVMEEHLKYLVDNGYDPIFFEDLNHVEQYDKPVILTFDDGYLDNYENLYPLLEKYQVKATIFVVTSSIGRYETSMVPEQVKELSDSGLVSIQSHTVSHSVLRELSPEEQAEEMRQSRLEVARMTGYEPFVISYPTGAYNEDTLEWAAEYYDFAVTVEPGDYVTGDDPWAIPRYNIRRTTTLEELAQMLSRAGERVA